MYQDIPKPTASYSDMDKPLSLISPFINDVSSIINSVSVAINAYKQDIYRTCSKPTASYDSITKPTI